MYLPSSAEGIPLFLDNAVDPTFQQLGDDLANRNLTTLEERHALMVEAPAALPCRIPSRLGSLTPVQSYAPYNCELGVSSDVGADVESTFMGPYNLRFAGVEGSQ